MAQVEPSDLSRYLNSDEYELRETDSLGNYLTTTVLIQSTPIRVSNLSMADDQPHTVKAGETLFTIAAKRFAGMRRPAGLYWAIGHYQNPPIHDCLEPLDPGRVLMIPSRQTLQEIILSESINDVPIESLADEVR